MQATQAVQAATEEWIDKSQVAERLKISERTALSLTGKIESKKVRSPESNQVVWMFHAGDVERYAFERDNPRKEVAVQPGGQASQRASRPALPSAPTQDMQTLAAGANASPAFLQTIDLAAILARVLEAGRLPLATSLLWMTTDEASAYSGLPAGFIAELIKSHRLPALDVGVRKGGRWRISRRDLDAMRAPEAKRAD